MSAKFAGGGGVGGGAGPFLAGSLILWQGNDLHFSMLFNSRGSYLEAMKV